MKTFTKSRFSKIVMGLVLIFLVAGMFFPTSTTSAAPANSNQHGGRTCWTTAYGYGLDTPWRDYWQHSNYLRVKIPTRDFWRVRSIYYDNQRVGPYDTSKVSGDISSHNGETYTDLRVSSGWAGYKWSWRDPAERHWKVEYLCY